MVNESNARAKRYLQDIRIHLETSLRIDGSAIQEDSYRKETGEWGICTTGYKRIFEASELLSKSQMITVIMFAAPEYT